MKKKRYDLINLMIMIISFLIRIIYVLNTDVGQRQHDLGYATSLSDELVNPGHLGYVEYIAKFHKLPDFDPFSIFSYYHPPLHHVIAAIFVDVAHSFGISEPKVYEFIQLPTCIYGCIGIYIVYRILKLISPDTKHICLPLALVAFHPGLIYMCGTVNNDMLAAMMSFLCIYVTLLWIYKGHSFRHLIYMALCIGIGLISKMNVAVLIFPMGLIMLLHLISSFKAHRIAACIKEYVVFALIALPIGLSWSVRNILRFSVGPGISSATPESNQYLGSYPLDEIIGLPVKSSVSFPFHSENAVYCHNAWSILFKTSLFGEIFPENIGYGALMICRFAFITAVILGFICFILSITLPIIRIRRGDKDTGVFLLAGYVSVLITYILFVIKYPYTCSCDFRYVPTSLIYAAISLLPLKQPDHQ